MPLKIANAQAFWGDDPHAAARLAASVPDLDFLTLDYLAEVSMSILAKQRDRDPSAGYAKDFLGVVESLAGFWRDGRRFKLVTNAGGLNPLGCATTCADILRKTNCRRMKIGIVSGDDVLPILRERAGDFRHMEDGRPLTDIAGSLVTANTYLGAGPVAEALARGADIVVTGRVADPSLTVGPCIAHFGWSANDYTQLAGATVAGHLIECGTQVTGGISTDWLSLPNNGDIGFPVAEIAADGSCVITKPTGTGGRVNEQTVKEQLLYELGDPARYLSPDSTVSFLGLNVRDEENDRVRVTGAKGSRPPETYKVSATCRAGFRASGMLVVYGRDAEAKARRCGEIVRDRMRRIDAEPRDYRVELIGAGAIGIPGGMGALPVPSGAHSASHDHVRSAHFGMGETPTLRTDTARDLMLRISVADDRRNVVEQFTRELMPLISAGPQGITGYADGRPAVREIFGYWPTLIDRSLVRATVELLEI